MGEKRQMKAGDQLLIAALAQAKGELEVHKANIKERHFGSGGKASGILGTLWPRACTNYKIMAYRTYPSSSRLYKLFRSNSYDYI